MEAAQVPPFELPAEISRIENVDDCNVVWTTKVSSSAHGSAVLLDDAALLEDRYLRLQDRHRDLQAAYRARESEIHRFRAQAISAGNTSVATARGVSLPRDVSKLIQQLQLENAESQRRCRELELRLLKVKSSKVRTAAASLRNQAQKKGKPSRASLQQSALPPLPLAPGDAPIHVGDGATLKKTEVVDREVQTESTAILLPTEPAHSSNTSSSSTALLTADEREKVSFLVSVFRERLSVIEDTAAGYRKENEELRQQLRQLHATGSGSAGGGDTTLSEELKSLSLEAKHKLLSLSRLLRDKSLELEKVKMSVEKQEILRQGEREDTAALRASLEESRKACEAMRVELLRLQSRDRDSARLEETVRELRHEIEVLKNELQGVQSLHSVEIKVESTERMADLVSLAEQSEEKLRVIESQVLQSQAALSASQAELNSKNAAIEKLREELEGKVREADEVRIQLLESKGKCEAAECELNTLKKLRSFSSMDLGLSIEEILTGYGDHAKLEKPELIKRYFSLRDTFATLHTDLQASESTISMQKRIIRTLEAQVQGYSKPGPVQGRRRPREPSSGPADRPPRKVL